MSDLFFPFVWYNHRYFEVREPLFSALSRNVNYGDGIFETLRVDKNKIYFWDFHFERLQNGIQTLNLIPTPILQDKSLLQDIILELLKKNKVQHKVKVKIQVFRSDNTGKVFPSDHHTDILIFCAEKLSEVYVPSIKQVILYPDIQLQYSVLSSIKTLNRLPYVLGGMYALKNQVEDALLSNTQQEWIESTHSNLFYIIDNELYTPPLSSGCLDGVMRRVILQNFKVKEQSLTLDTFKHVDVLFMTNVIRGLSIVYKCKNLDKTFDIEHVLIKDILCFLNAYQ